MDISRRALLQRGAAIGALAMAALREDALAIAGAADQRAGGRSPGELSGDEDFWVPIQQAFAVDRSLINLNNGGVSPSPRVAQEALRRHLDFANNAPARNMWTLQDPQVESVRAMLARAFGCAAEEMAITRNASESLETCIYGLDLKAGDEVVTTSQDYPRMINTYKQRELREGIVLKQVQYPTPLEDPKQVVDAFAAAITSKTRVLHCSHVIFLTGQIMPVREIVRLGRQHGLPVVVDGAHAFAHLAFRRDDLECDYYGTSLHKWLTAPIGAGFLYVRDERIADLWPLMAAPEPKKKDIRKFEEIGTHPAANRLAIAEAVTFYEAIGAERKEARLRYLKERWARRLMQDKRVRLLTRLDPEHSCALGTMAIEGVEPAKLAEHLWSKHRIVVVAIDHPEVKGVRVTPNVYTTPSDIDRFCEAVEDVLVRGT